MILFSILNILSKLFHIWLIKKKIEDHEKNITYYIKYWIEWKISINRK